MEKEILALRPEVEESQDQDLMTLDDMNLIVMRAEKNVEMLKKVLAVAIKRTTPQDWVDMQGKPYLTASGAEKLMPLFGVSLKGTKSSKQWSDDDQGRYYTYQYIGTFFWKGGAIEALGVCTSRDKFFAWNGKEQTFKPLSEVDEGNIVKAAYSNMMVNGVTRLLGIRNLTWEQVKSFGIDQAKTARVEYGGKKATPDETKMQNDVGQMLLEMSFNDKDKAFDMLEGFTSFTGRDGTQVSGVKNVRKLTNKRLQVTYGKVKKEYQTFLEMSGVSNEG